MEQGRARLKVEGQGLLDLQADVRSTGIIFRSDGETFEHMCVRISHEYGAPLADVKIELEHFQ
jgi:hypothetical protein